MREAFELEAKQTGKDRLLITMAVPASLEYAGKGFDIKTLNQALDFFNLLTYDYHSGKKYKVVRVVEFSNGGYKIRKIFALEATCQKEIIEF